MFIYWILIFHTFVFIYNYCFYIINFTFSFISINRYFIQEGEELCRYQGLRIQFFFLASALWTTAIAFTIFFIVVLNKEIYKIERYEYIYHLVIWGICCLTTIYLYFKDIHHFKGQPWVMGDATFWCWITNHSSKLRFYLFFGPLWLIFFINLTMYVTMKIICKRRNINTSQIYAKNTIASRWHLYLLVLIVTWLWGTINRIQNTINEGKPIFTLYLLHAVSLFIIYYYYFFSLYLLKHLKLKYLIINEFFFSLY